MKRKIKVTVFIKLVCYKDSEIFSNTELVSNADKKRRQGLKFYKDPLWAKAICGSPFDSGAELEFPIRHEYADFLDDCEFVIKNAGFIILERRQSTDSHPKLWLQALEDV